jgi:hypothetical protein
MSPLVRVLVEECYGGLNEPHVGAKEQRKLDWSRFPQRHIERNGGGFPQRCGSLSRLRQLPLADNLNHTGADVG